VKTSGSDPVLGESKIHFFLDRVEACPKREELTDRIGRKKDSAVDRLENR